MKWTWKNRSWWIKNILGNFFDDSSLISYTVVIVSCLEWKKIMLWNYFLFPVIYVCRSFTFSGDHYYVHFHVYFTGCLKLRNVNLRQNVCKMKKISIIECLYVFNLPMLIDGATCTLMPNKNNFHHFGLNSIIILLEWLCFL